MSTNRFGDLLDTAKKEGYSSSLIPDSTYEFEITDARASKTNKDESQFGLRFKVLDGPHAGEAAWENMTLREDKPKALAFFFGFLAKFGLTDQWLAEADPTDEQIAAKFKGQRGTMEVGHRSYTGRDGEKTVNTIRVIRVHTDESTPDGPPATSGGGNWLN